MIVGTGWTSSKLFALDGVRASTRCRGHVDGEPDRIELGIGPGDSMTTTGGDPTDVSCDEIDLRSVDEGHARGTLYDDDELVVGLIVPKAVR